MYLATGLYKQDIGENVLDKNNLFYFFFLYVLHVCCTPSGFCNCTIYVWHHCEVKDLDKTSIFQLFSSLTEQRST